MRETCLRRARRHHLAVRWKVPLPAAEERHGGAVLGLQGHEVGRWAAEKEDRDYQGPTRGSWGPYIGDLGRIRVPGSAGRLLGNIGTVGCC